APRRHRSPYAPGCPSAPCAGTSTRPHHRRCRHNAGTIPHPTSINTARPRGRADQLRRPLMSRNPDLAPFARRLSGLLAGLDNMWADHPDFNRQAVLEHLEADLRRLHADMLTVAYRCDAPDCDDPSHLATDTGR